MPGGFEPPEQTDEIKLAISAWNLCGGMNWDAIPIVAEIFGYDDIELFVRLMAAMREHNKEAK